MLKRQPILRNQSGMTLIEIVIVMIIIATLMATLGGGIMDRFQKSKQNNARIQIAEITKSLDIFYSDCNFYPSTEQGLNALLSAPSSPSCNNWGPKAYIKQNLLKDPWNNEFIYERQSSSEFYLKTLGADGEEGGDGLNADLSNMENEDSAEEN